ncbi:hypothetical protein, partial [Vibrio cidicii]|uniref:hypothetical protein n=1 Tax=Vibrio cidicii TaxID=1763883 RepID=UPI0037039D56
ETRLPYTKKLAFFQIARIEMLEHNHHATAAVAPVSTLPDDQIVRVMAFNEFVRWFERELAFQH